MIDKNLIEKCEQSLQPKFALLEEIALFNQEKVLNAFKKNRIALRHFSGTSGYGYGDDGRDTLNSLFADVFNAEKVCVCGYIFSHALLVLWLFPYSVFWDPESGR